MTHSHVILIAVLSCSLAAGSASAQLGADVSQPVALNTNAEEDAGVDWRPSVAVDGNGTWLAVWHSNDSLGNTIGTDLDILWSRSTDGGRSWTEPDAVNPGATSDTSDEIHPSIATDGRGTWMVAWAAPWEDPTPILVSRSTDDGDTWSNPVLVAVESIGQLLTPKLVTDGSGTWVAAWWEHHLVGKVWAARSVDDGLTWSEPHEFDSDVDFGGLYRSIALDHDGAGTWVVMWDDDDGLLFSRSVDSASTWSEPGPIEGFRIGWQTPPGLATDRAGNWIVVAPGIEELAVSRSSDNGASWSIPVDITDTISSDRHRNPIVVADRQGRWVLLWERDDVLGPQSNIVQVSLSTDAGLTWTDPETIFGGTEGDDAFTSLATDQLGNWVLLWDSEDDPDGVTGPDRDLFVVRWAFCGISVEGRESTQVRFQPSTSETSFDLVTGLLSDLRSTGGFPGAYCLGRFTGTPAEDTLPAPGIGDGRYYLAHGLTECAGQGYGDSTLTPDPRDELDNFDPCP